MFAHRFFALVYFPGRYFPPVPAAPPSPPSPPPDSGAGAGHGGGHGAGHRDQQRSAYLQELLIDAELAQRRAPIAEREVPNPVRPESTIKYSFYEPPDDSATIRAIEARLAAQGLAQDRIAATLAEIDALLAERAALMAMDDDAIAAILMMVA